MNYNGESEKYTLNRNIIIYTISFAFVSVLSPGNYPTQVFSFIFLLTIWREKSERRYKMCCFFNYEV